MPLDSFVLAGVRSELLSSLSGAKVDKVVQCARDEVLCTMRTRSASLRLFISARFGAARVGLTDVPRDNLPEPPMFCMLLRKYLVGGRLTDITQPPFERALRLCFTASDELGDDREVALIFECAGKVPNLILTDGNGTIIDCLKRVSLDQDTPRPLLPGLTYRLPPSPADRVRPDGLSRGEIATLIASRGGIQKAFFGFSPLLARQAELSPDPAAALLDITGCYLNGSLKPYALVNESGAAKDCTAYPCALAAAEKGLALREYDSFSHLQDDVYSRREAEEKLDSRRSALAKPLKTHKARLERKLALQREELKATIDRERKRQFGDILNAYLYMIPRGASSVRLQDIYSESGGEVDIPLDARLNPQQNAQKYYQQYSKLKSAKAVLERIIDEGEREKSYLDEALYSVSAADGDTLPILERELADGGYVKAKADKRGRKPKVPAAAPREYALPCGLTVLVGRTGRENEELTFRIASRDDIWFHVKNAPGSHCVLVRGRGEIPDEAYTEAAELAASHSSLAGSDRVEVDYCPVRNVKKMPGGKPGMVIYNRYFTATVKPK